MFAAFPRFADFRRFTHPAAFIVLTFAAVFFVPPFSAQAAESAPSSPQTEQADADEPTPPQEAPPRRRVVLKAPLATLRKSADASPTPNAAPFSAPELNATAAPLDDARPAPPNATDATDAVPTSPDATDAAFQTLLGREIADYRLQNGAGRYVFEEELGELLILENAWLETVEDAPEPELDALRSDLAERLRAEFGPGFETVATKRYLFVHNVSDAYVDWCARLFEKVADAFDKYAVKSKLPTTERVEPMVVVIFATQRQFFEYAARETPSPDKLAAYYNMQTNRVALYDLSGAESNRAAADDAEPERRRRAFQETKEFLSRPNAAFNVATIVHEASHQVAFNRGLFLRTGPFPFWAVEGLALTFETPNGRASQGGWNFTGSFPKNERLLERFRQYAATTRQRDPLRSLVTAQNIGDARADVEGFYSASWALFYYLYKRRPNELAAYLRETAAKPAFVAYPAADRIADFEKHFGDDWEKLTENLLRFVRRL
ncbi:MAG: DUF1570 domain-containing protein [Thermoguttaceae bacterium]|nr:DUF1570 domain-containing protein [Thermoguttaceae bacterium]